MAEDRCLASAVADGDATMKRYASAAVDRIKRDHDSDATLEKFIAAQKAWADYRTSECDAVFESWGDASARIAQEEVCSMTLARLRTYEIWSNWLTYFGGTPPDLPKPVVEEH
jgi:uncharacterized protein YecT (DUF1311 family)